MSMCGANTEIHEVAAGNDVAKIYNNSYPPAEGVFMMNSLTGGRKYGENALLFALNN
ncbi:MAG: hypothetical protein J6M92_10145 [Oribacterium sp.]|nr:hypothetical protein [Oribacterium sp.]